MRKISFFSSENYRFYSHEYSQYIAYACYRNARRFSVTSCKNVSAMYTPYTPLLYSNTGVYRGIHYFLICALKHTLWVLVRSLIEAVITRTHDLCFEKK